MPSFMEQKLLYDNACKEVLSEKEIFAQIMHTCMDEYRDIPPGEIARRYIEGTPAVASVPVMGDGLLTKISGLPCENGSIDETPTFYDVHFTALAPPLNHPIHLFVNGEAQNRSNPGYPLLMRGIFYGSRMLSHQYGTVFTHSDYGRIRKVYSVWICTHPPKKQEYTINSYSMQERQLAGDYHANPRHYDLITIIVINLGTKSAKELTGLFRLLNALFLDRMKAEELGNILKNEYSIHLTPTLKKGVESMCNLSEGIWEDGMQQGMQQGIQQGIQQGEDSSTIKALKSIMQKMNITLEDAMNLCDVPNAKRKHYADLL